MFVAMGTVTARGQTTVAVMLGLQSSPDWPLWCGTCTVTAQFKPSCHARLGEVVLTGLCGQHSLQMLVRLLLLRPPAVFPPHSEHKPLPRQAPSSRLSSSLVSETPPLLLVSETPGPSSCLAPVTFTRASGAWGLLLPPVGRGPGLCASPPPQPPCPASTARHSLTYHPLVSAKNFSLSELLHFL